MRYVKREEARDALQEIPNIEPFPADALEKLSRIEADVQRLEVEYGDLTEKHSHTEEEFERCVVRGEVLGQADAIHALERKIEQYRTRVNDLKTAQLEGEQQRANLASMLKALGGDWDEERSTMFDTSVPAKDDAKQLRDRLAKTANDCAVQQSRLEVAETEAGERKESQGLQRRRDDIGDVADPGTARERLGLSREMLSEIQHVQELETRLFSVRQEEARTAEIKASIHSVRAIPSWPGILVALSALLIFVWGSLTGTLEIAGIIALILLVAAAGIFLARRKAGEEGNIADAAHHEGEGETLALQRREIEHERSRREEKIRSCAASLGCDSLPTRTAVEALVHAHEDAVREADRASDLDKEIDRAQDLSGSADASLNKAQEMMDAALSEREDAQAAWRRWCRERIFLKR